MKKIYFLLFIFATIIYSCTGVKSTVKGLDNESFLSFYSDNDKIINSNIEVTLEKTNSFLVQVNKIRRNSTNFEKRPNGKAYSIKPGKNEIEITSNGKLIYRKKIFISNQETKIIKL